jgi:hypothetical protein
MARRGESRGPLGRPHGGLAVVAAFAVILAACNAAVTPGPSADLGNTTPGPSQAASAQPGDSATPSGSPVAPTIAPTTGPTIPPLAAIQVNMAVRVTVASLNVREHPATTAKKMGSLAKGDVVVLLGYGGIRAGGYVWFEAARIKGLHGPLPPLPTYPLQGGSWSDLTGWIAIGTSGTGGTAYVTPLPARCGAADTATISAQLASEQLACLGSTPLELQGTFGCGGCGGAFPGTFTPDWLATPLSGFFSANLANGVGPLQLYFPPSVTRPAEGSILRVRGHFGDSRSSTCAVAIPTSDSFDAPPVPLRAGDSAIWCRQHLVVDSYDVLGVDPSFPPG